MNRAPASPVLGISPRVRNVVSKERRYDLSASPKRLGRLHGVPPFEGERMIRQLAGNLALPAGVAIAIGLLASPAIAGSSPAPLLIPDSALHAVSATVGGAKPQPSTSTLTHFFRTAFNPLD